jgi:hypothetical protein
MLPLDDLELEMEEVEGLVEVSTVGRGKTSRSSRASASQSWALLLLVVVL